jgi:TetR/AcrR family transcriptional regulator of autoinduction and epiphytic fitness
VRDGYAATSIAAIAEEAGVAVPTVYATLQSKAGVMRAVVDLTVRGDDGAAPLASRAHWQEIEGPLGPHERLARFAHLHREICEREAAVFAQLEAAAGADAEATRLLAEHDGKRYETQSRLAAVLESHGQLRPDLSAQQAATAPGRSRASAPTWRWCAIVAGRPRRTSVGSPSSWRPRS